MLNRYLQFKEDVYSSIEETGGLEVLVWKANKKYLLLEEYDTYYLCETELHGSEGRHIEKGFNQMGTDVGLFDVVI